MHQRPPLPAGASSESFKTPKHASSHTSGSDNGKKSSASVDNSTPKKSLLRRKPLAVSAEDDHENLDFFTNNHFSRSFNSLILEDDSDNVTKRGSKTKINKSPPFNIKNDIYHNDTIDDNLEDDDEDLDSDMAAAQSSTFKMIRLRASNSNVDLDDHLDNDADDDKDTTIHALHPLSHTKSAQSSIKRSSKYLNLSIDSNINKTKLNDVDYISDLNEIDTAILRTSREHTPIENSSPLHKIITPFNTRQSVSNKFKRPHQLISKSPSPVSLKLKSSQSHLQSPSKLGIKPLLAKDRLSSTTQPPASSKESSMLSINKFFNLKKLSPVRLSSPTTIKIRKTVKSPKITDSSPINFEYYNVEDVAMDSTDDSPSKGRKLSSSSNVSTNNQFQIYQDPATNDQIQMLHQREEAKLPKNDFNDKENEEVKKNSYQFVKPLQTAFKSTGLVKKNSINASQRKLPPETPFKRHPIMLFNENSSSKPRSKFYDNESANTAEASIEVGRNHSHNITAHSNDSTLSFLNINLHVNDHDFNPTHDDGPASDADHILEDVRNEILETPTKSVKKSSSTPANFSPVSFQRKFKKLNGSKLQVKTKHNLDFKLNEPSTPIHPVKKFKSNSSMNAPLNSSQNATYVDTKAMITDEHLNKKFGAKNIRYLSKGEFSMAFECVFDNQKFAIKRSKRPIIGKLETKTILREIDALRVLTSVKDNESINLKEQEEGKEYLVYFIEAWEFNKYYYIMTELCEGGTLFDFLEENKNYKLDEFRTWKILIEILSGLKFIHAKNYLHLDLKPANIFITFEGSLKIGDFGLATRLPILEKDFDIEGDRNYIAPELINDKIYTPFADIFSVGLIILEIAANIILPENGTPWRKLRSGDLSDAGKLSSDNISDFLNNRNFSSLTSYNSTNYSSNSSISPNQPLAIRPPTNLDLPVDSRQLKDLIPFNAPDFLVNDSDNMDKLVNRMLQPNPFDRPTATKILEMNECVVIENIRKAGATIFEGEFGPTD